MVTVSHANDNTDTLFASRAPLLYISALTGKAKALHLWYNSSLNTKSLPFSINLLDTAYVCYCKAINQISQLRKTYLFEESKLFLAENQKETYFNAMQVTLELYKAHNQKQYLNKAFMFGQELKEIGRAHV